MHKAHLPYIQPVDNLAKDHFVLFPVKCSGNLQIIKWTSDLLYPLD